MLEALVGLCEGLGQELGIASLTKSRGGRQRPDWYRGNAEDPRLHNGSFESSEEYS